MSKIDDIRKHYVPRITPDRANHDVLDWAGPDTQAARFEVLLRRVDLAGRSLLDVGCGLGDLAGLLRRRNIPVRYTGVDVVEEMLARARQANPNERFLRADMFHDDAADDPLGGETFDVVYCSGALNLNLGNNLEFLETALPRLLRATRDVLMVNFLRARDAARDPTYFYYRPADVLSVLHTLLDENRVEIIEDYLPNDFTVLCRIGGK
ncbi:MAG: class I SAM-dependent methyltransferase [Phycisphaerae bacterium]|nr:class I SAM-dependent methyltransferase [Phycisphaerae bacterium]